MLLCLAILGTPTQAKAHNGLDMSRKKYGAIMPDAYYDLIAQMETGITGDDWSYNSRSYTSALGIHKQTAYRWSGHRNLNKLSKREIIRVADRIAFAGWQRPDGEFVWPVGPFGWGTVRHSKLLRAYICASPHWRTKPYKKRACHG